MIRLHNIGLSDSNGVSPDDIITSKTVESRLLPVESALNAFLRLVDDLEHIAKQSCLKNTSSTVRKDWKLRPRQYRGKLYAYMNNLHMLPRKCSSASQFVNDVFNYHDQRIARRQNVAILTLTNWTVKDATKIRVMAAIIFSFLAFTTVAVSLFRIDEI